MNFSPRLAAVLAALLCAPAASALSLQDAQRAMEAHNPDLRAAALELGADVSRIAMAVAWGDAWTNLIQPFWALPVLAIAGLKARDIMGFCLMQLMITGVIISIALSWF